MTVDEHRTYPYKHDPTSKPEDVYYPNETEVLVALAVGRGRWKTGTNPFMPAERRFTDENKMHGLVEFVGCLGEIATSRLTNLCWTGCGRREDLYPYKDVGNWIEVRSVYEPDHGALVRPHEDPEAPVVCVYVHRSADGLKWVTEFRGWEWAGTIQETFPLDPGPQQCYICRPDKLRPMRELLARIKNPETAIADLREIEKKKQMGLFGNDPASSGDPMCVTFIDPPCRCEDHPFPHYHPDGKRRSDLYTFGK